MQTLSHLAATGVTAMSLFLSVSFAGAPHAAAQVANPNLLEMRRGALVTPNGEAFSKAQIKELLADDAVFQTYCGATKQYRAGNQLLNAGIFVSALSASAAFIYGLISGANGNTPAQTMAGMPPAILVAEGIGTCLISVGIPLKCVGSCRLDWVAEQYNEGCLRAPATEKNALWEVSFRLTGAAEGLGCGLAIGF